MKLTPYQEDVYKGSICPYCKSATKSVTEEFIYGKKYKGKMMICCINFPTCDSYVGTHEKDSTALGRLANRELRQYKKVAHSHFDWIWKNEYEKRGFLYKELSDFLGIDAEYTHIGYFNIATCKKVIDWAIQRKKKWQ